MTFARLRAALRVVALLALVGLAAQNAIGEFVVLRRHEPGETCPRQFDERYAKLRDYLPKSGVVGYIGPDLVEDACNAKYLAMYSLAPMLVTRVDEEELRKAARNTDYLVPLRPLLVIVDTSEPEAQTWLAEHPEYRVVLDAGDGLYLASKTR